MKMLSIMRCGRWNICGVTETAHQNTNGSLTGRGSEFPRTASREAEGFGSWMSRNEQRALIALRTADV